MSEIKTKTYNALDADEMLRLAPPEIVNPFMEMLRTMEFEEATQIVERILVATYGQNLGSSFFCSLLVNDLSHRDPNDASEILLTINNTITLIHDQNKTIN